MTAAKAAHARLLNISALTALVGTQITVGKFAQQTPLPAVCVFLIDAIDDQHLRGPQGTPTARITVESRARTKAGVDAVAEAAHGDGLGTHATGLYGWIGTIGSPSFRIDNVRDAGRREGYDADELRQFYVQHDYFIDYRGASAGA